MKMTQVRDKAKQMSIKSAKMTKEDLIRAIQSQEGNFPCFKTPSEYCDQVGCSWREDCMPRN